MPLSQGWSTTRKQGSLMPMILYETLVCPTALQAVPEWTLLIQDWWVISDHGKPNYFTRVIQWPLGSICIKMKGVFFIEGGLALNFLWNTISKQQRRPIRALILGEICAFSREFQHLRSWYVLMNSLFGVFFRLNFPRYKLLNAFNDHLCNWRIVRAQLLRSSSISVKCQKILRLLGQESILKEQINST